MYVAVVEEPKGSTTLVRALGPFKTQDKAMEAGMAFINHSRKPKGKIVVHQLTQGTIRGEMEIG